MTLKSILLLAALLHAGPALAWYKSCVDIQMHDPSAPNGEYTIEPAPGVVFSVYCYGMGHWGPVEYLTLPNTGGDFNFGQYTAGGNSPGTSVRTSFRKVRIDPFTLLVDIGDLTFATSTGLLRHSGANVITSVAFGIAADCIDNQSQAGIGNIDLTGTPFKVQDVFFEHGWGSGFVIADGQSVSLPQNEYPVSGVSGKVLTVQAGGYCGAAGPQGINSSHNQWMRPTPGMTALQLVYTGQ